MPSDRREMVYRRTADLRPHPENPRTHSDDQVAQLSRLIDQYGWTNPLLIDEEGMILAGHGRQRTALRRGDEEVPTITIAGLSAAEKWALVVADNQSALNAGWDDVLLAAGLHNLEAADFDLSILGFEADELKFLLAPDPGDGPDIDPEPPENPKTQLGDVWVMGPHRIICGDSTDAETVATVLDGAEPHLMVTDPPYGVEYDPEWRKKVKGPNGSPLQGGNGAFGTVMNDDRSDWREAWALFPGDVAYVWHSGIWASNVDASLEAAGFHVRAQIIWNKSRLLIGRGDYHWKHEPCWYAVREGKTGHYSGDRKQSTVWDIDKPQKSETGHSTQKPVECMRKPIENNSKVGDAIYEPFSGSGTTIIAAEQTGRVCYAIELNPAYVDVAVLRWQSVSSQRAFRESDGVWFDEVEVEALAA